MEYSVYVWIPFTLGCLLTIIGVTISTPHRRPVLFWTSVFAPITVPVCTYGLFLLSKLFIEILKKIQHRHDTDINQGAADTDVDQAAAETYVDQAAAETDVVQTTTGPDVNSNIEAFFLALISIALEQEQQEPPNTNRVHPFHISSLPTRNYNEDAVEGGPMCPICKELFERGDVMIQLPLCIHSFHKECIKSWLQTNMTCPVCRCRVDLEVPTDIAVTIDE